MSIFSHKKTRYKLHNLVKKADNFLSELQKFSLSELRYSPDRNVALLYDLLLGRIYSEKFEADLSSINYQTPLKNYCLKYNRYRQYIVVKTLLNSFLDDKTIYVIPDRKVEVMKDIIYLFPILESYTYANKKIKLK